MEDARRHGDADGPDRAPRHGQGVESNGIWRTRTPIGAYGVRLSVVVDVYGLWRAETTDLRELASCSRTTLAHSHTHLRPVPRLDISAITCLTTEHRLQARLKSSSQRCSTSTLSVMANELGCLPPPTDFKHRRRQPFGYHRRPCQRLQQPCFWLHLPHLRCRPHLHSHHRCCCCYCCPHHRRALAASCFGGQRLMPPECRGSNSNCNDCVQRIVVHSSWCNLAPLPQGCTQNRAAWSTVNINTPFGE
jgi:hypothetical protein